MGKLKFYTDPTHRYIQALDKPPYQKAGPKYWNGFNETATHVRLYEWDEKKGRHVAVWVKKTEI